MKFEQTLLEGTLIKRYKRFLSDIELSSGEIITAHCPNSGSMLSLINKNAKVYVSPNNNPKTKLDWRWEIIEHNNNLVGINTNRPNYIVKEAIENKKIKYLLNYKTLKTEQKYGTNSRIDILLETNDNKNCYIEIKNVTMSRHKKIAEFPDSVTSRGTKHLKELINMTKLGHRSIMIYLVNRSDSDSIKIAKDIDPIYYNTFKLAINNKVEAYAYKVTINKNEIVLEKEIPFINN